MANNERKSFRCRTVPDDKVSVYACDEAQRVYVLVSVPSGAPMPMRRTLDVSLPAKVARAFAAAVIAAAEHAERQS